MVFVITVVKMLRDQNHDSKKEQALPITLSQYDWFISQNERSWLAIKLGDKTTRAWRVQRCLDSHRHRQISRSDCEITGNCGKNSFLPFLLFVLGCNWSHRQSWTTGRSGTEGLVWNIFSIWIYLEQFPFCFSETYLFTVFDFVIFYKTFFSILWQDNCINTNNNEAIYSLQKQAKRFMSTEFKVARAFNSSWSPHWMPNDKKTARAKVV